MSKHTPGPWHYRRFDEWTHTVVTNHGKLPDGRPSDWAIASINKSREPEHEANAQLISAAPDLLAAAKLVIAWYEAEDDHSKADFYQRLQMCRDSETACRAAVAKAEEQK